MLGSFDTTRTTSKNITCNMNSVVEATSLQSVTALATNPPLHPSTPIQSSGPLVLYIARVPGSRDVFLTPIKPREKIITAEDVQSSLYYVHVNCEQDYCAAEPTPLLPTSASRDASQVPTVMERPKRVPPPLPRRPAPPVSPPYPVDDPMPAFRGRPPSPQKAQHISRKTVLLDITNTSPTRQQAPYLPDLPRRPLPTPPDEHPSAQSLHADNVRLLRYSEHIDDNNNPYMRDYPNHPETLRKLEIDSMPESGSLTLIRRNPGSTEQWNVASIHDPPVHEVSSTSLLVPTSARRAKRGGAPLYLDITNPGYSQFLARPEHAESRTSTSSPSSDGELPPEGVFRRRLYMPGSRYGEHGYGAGHRKHLSVSSASTDEMRKTMRDRHSVDLGSLGPPKADRRSKGYTFTSPWEGRCEFTTGATGKSLKCRHQLPPQGSTREVSELRFNLPNSARNTPTAVSEKRASYFTHRHSHVFSSLEDGSRSPIIMIDEDTGKIDLSLGQERAGGGFGGKQAKLGKLIIEPEGFKMLDLLVAANVGLWWRAYERF